MPSHPQFLSKTPRTEAFEAARGDVLADVIGLSLVRSALYKRIEARAPWGIRKGPKPRAIFYLLAQGAAWLEVEGEPAVKLGVGDAAFLPHGTPHVLRDAKTTATMLVADGPPRPSPATRRIGGHGARSSIIVCFFERDAGRTPVLLANMPNVAVLSASEPADPWTDATVKLILAESVAPGPASAFLLQRLADVLFVQALRALSHQPDGPPGLAAVSDPAMYRALSLMHADVAKAWTVTELAHRVGLSRSGFAARFTTLVGEPPLRYLARWRLARAAELLRDTDDGIVEIAARIGYQSVPSFSRTFKRWHGQSPAAFRREVRKPSRTARASVTTPSSKRRLKDLYDLVSGRRDR